MKPTTLIYQYLKKYQLDPTSRVFAPLSEAYRRAGLLDEAIDVAREGLKIHPHFAGGKVALARALFEAKKYDEVVEELSPLVQDVPDNLAAQRLLAESALMIGRTLDALTAYKMLLYFRPEDQEISKIVLELEQQAYEDGALVISKDVPQGAHDFEIKSTSDAMGDDPAFKKNMWMGRIQGLQKLLQNVERYRWRNATRGKSAAINPAFD